MLEYFVSQELLLQFNKNAVSGVDVDLLFFPLIIVIIVS